MLSKKQINDDLISEDFKQFKNNMDESCSISADRLVLLDDSVIESTKGDYEVGCDQVYAVQHQWAARWFMQIWSANQEYFPNIFSNQIQFKCLDVGSRIEFVYFLSTFTNFISVDPSFRPKNTRFHQFDAGLCCCSAEAQNIPFKDGIFSVLTSLHAIEHFGLGRYGDTLDPHGDIRGLKEFNRLLSPDGYFIGSVPVRGPNCEVINFNGERIYTTDIIDSLLDSAGFNIVDSKVVTSTDLFKKQFPTPRKEFPDGYPASWVEKDDFNTILQSLEADEIMQSMETNEYPISAYVWIAKKTIKEE